MFSNQGYNGFIMEKPISVIMSVYNEKEDYLRQSIESVLGQSFPDFEFIIMNDGPEFPEVKKILDEYSNRDSRIKVYTNETNLGLTRSLNKALDLATGKYIARLDSDDLAHPDRLQKQFAFMEAHSDHALSGSFAVLIDENGKQTGLKKSPTDGWAIKKQLLFYNFFTHSSFFFRTDIAKELGSYNTQIKKAQDYDFLLKLSAKYPITILPEFLCLHRIHSQSISARSKKKQEQYALIARWNAIAHYGYPKTDFWKILPALFYFLFIPHFLEEKIWKILRKNK